MSNKYKKLLFDLDNTLVDDDENRKYAIKKILLERGEFQEEKIDSFIKLDDKFWKDRAEGRIPNPYEFKNDEEKTEWVRAQRFIMYFNNISLQDAIEINKKYINYLSECVVSVKNAQNILKYLYNKNYEIYIATNSPKKLLDYKLNGINAKQYIKDTFCAEEAGHMKPHDVFFDKMFDKIGLYEKDEAIIIGDELEKDVFGGIKNNIDSCWFNRKKLENDTIFVPTYEINDLLELKNIL